jgi:phenylacetate-CoA ligase
MWIEFVDPETGEPAPPGGVGELVATQLGERAMPLLRYAPGDLYRTWAEPCPCGDPSTRVDIIGQVGVIRKIRGVLVHPAQVKDALSAFPELGRFQIVVAHADGARYDHASIRIGCDAVADRAALAQQVRERLRANIMLQLDVELVPQDQIPESAGAPRFVDAFVDRRMKQ